MARAGTTRVTGLNEILNLLSTDNPVSIPLLSTDASAGRTFILNFTPLDFGHYSEVQKTPFSKTQLDRLLWFCAHEIGGIVYASAPFVPRYLWIGAERPCAINLSVCDVRRD